MTAQLSMPSEVLQDAPAPAHIARKGGQRLFAFDNFPGARRIIDDRFNFAAMANDTPILEQPFHIRLSETRNYFEIKIIGCLLSQAKIQAACQLLTG